jgi:hypothetical protein
MDDINEKKKKLEQKKNRLVAEENRLKIKERKMRTRHLIEMGGLVTKAKLDHLATNTLYGALLSLKEQLDSSEENSSTLEKWTASGKSALDIEESLFTPVIIKFNNQPEKELRNTIRSHGLRWNKFRSEWYGNVTDLDSLKKAILNIEHQIEIIE